MTFKTKLTPSPKSKSISSEKSLILWKIHLSLSPQNQRNKEYARITFNPQKGNGDKEKDFTLTGSKFTIKYKSKTKNTPISLFHIPEDGSYIVIKDNRLEDIFNAMKKRVREVKKAMSEPQQRQLIRSCL